MLLAKENDLAQREGKLTRAESHQRLWGFQQAIPLLSKRPLAHGNLAMDKENDVLNVKRKYTCDPEIRAKMFEDVTNNGFAVRHYPPELEFRNGNNFCDGYVRPSRLLSDFR